MFVANGGLAREGWFKRLSKGAAQKTAVGKAVAWSEKVREES